METKAQWAARYAQMGWSIFPCHSITKGICSCRKECSSPGKHPITKNGFKDATSDVNKVREYWKRFPDANIGGITGTVSGFIVIDLDVKHGRSVKEMLDAMRIGHYEVPPTVCSDTGEYSDERGSHFFFKAPKGVPIKSTSGFLDSADIKGVDIRGEGGYVILPPSRHASGVSYDWKMSPFNAEPSDAPEWIIERQKTDKEDRSQDWEDIFNSDVLEGMRNDTATRVAGKLLQAMPAEAWSLGWELFKIWNSKIPKPLKESELKSVWKSIEKAEKAGRKKAEERPKKEPRLRIAKCPMPEKAVSFGEWRAAIYENFPDLHFASETALSVVSQFLIKEITNPFALVLVDVPSSGKTIAINFFADIPELSYATDKFTPASFVSNAANVKKEKLEEIDLLPRLQYRMFMIRDLATLFSKREDDLNEALGILTRVLDGEGLNTDSGVHGQREYNGEYLFMLLAASTPIPPRVMKAMGTLGSRLFFLKINSRDKSEDDLVNQVVDLSYKEKEKACRLITRDFLYSLWNCYPDGVIWDKKSEDKTSLAIVARCAMLLARLRGVINVYHDDFNNEFKYGSPNIEKPDRLNQLFYNLARGHALIQGRTQIGRNDLTAIVELCIDGAPTSRATLFRKLIEYKGSMTTSEVEVELNCSKPTALKEMKTLQILGVCSLREGVSQDNEISLSEGFRWFLSEECEEIRALRHTPVR